jgi:hypothetical protein
MPLARAKATNDPRLEIAMWHRLLSERGVERGLRTQRLRHATLSPQGLRRLGTRRIVEDAAMARAMLGIHAC